MGWVSYLEDKLERFQNNIHMMKPALQDEEKPSEGHRQAALKALKDAEAILAEAWAHLELATSPELDFAHEIKRLKKRIGSLEVELKVAKHETKKKDHESASNYAELQDVQHEVKKLKKEKRKLEKDFERVAQSDFGAAVEAYSSEGMVNRHKPNP